MTGGESDEPVVVIIGAGAAGVMAADTILRAGGRCVVLEGGAQAGGRIRALEGFAGFPIELGAEEVHGLGHKLADFAPRAGLIEHQTANDYLRLDGRILRLSEAGADADVARVLEFVGTVAENKVGLPTVGQTALACRIPKRVWHYLDSRLGVEHGTTIDRLGMRAFATYERGWELRENNRTVRGRYWDLFAPVMESVLPHIRFGAVVEEIRLTGEGVEIRLAGGDVIAAPAVIFTGSLAMLKAGAPAFDPPLPREKKEAIEAIGMDSGMKLLLRFREKFWPAEMYFLHTDGFFPQFWACGKGRGGDDAVLTAFLGGARATMLEGRDPVPLALNELDGIFGEQSATRHFDAAFVADWGSEPLVRGLYSYATASTTPAHRIALAAPVGRRIFFAGEATDTHGHTGTVHGAMETGIRAATEALAALA